MKNAPYVYLLTHKETKQFYVGYRESNILPSEKDILEYKSSSKMVRALGFENFDIVIVAEFFDGDSAYDFENRLIEKHIKNPLCLNGHYTKDGKNRFKTIEVTEETKLKISKSLTGRTRKPLSDDHKEKLRIGRIQSAEEKLARSIKQTGKKRGPYGSQKNPAPPRKHSIEERKARSERMKGISRGPYKVKSITHII